MIGLPSTESASLLLIAAPHDCTAELCHRFRYCHNTLPSSASHRHLLTIIIDTYRLSMLRGDDSALSLQLERDNPCNTTIVDQGGNTLYAVETDFANLNRPVMRVHDSIGKLVAE